MSYENDVVAWAREQATLLRERKFSAVDVEHIAEEIEAVGRAEQRELVSRMSVFLTGLLLWKHLSAHFELETDHQGAAIGRCLPLG